MRRPPRILYTILYIAAFVISFVTVCISSMPYVSAQTSDDTGYVFIAFGVFTLVLLFLPNKESPRKMTPALWFLLFGLAVALPFAVLKNSLAINRIDAIAIFLRDHDIADIASFSLETVSTPVARYGMFCAVAFLSAYLVQTRKRYFNFTLLICTLFLFALSPISNWAWETLFPSKFKRDFDLAANIAGVEVTKKPEVQRNLVIFYLESIEGSYEKLPQTQKEMKPIVDFAAQNTRATNVKQVAGADITIAGIIATQCGVPFLTLVSNRYLFKQTSTDAVETFMPNVWCLGDQLAADGYTASYMNGASLQKFSKGSFLASHGYQRIMGKETLEDAGTEYEKNYFGATDEFLFDAAITEYTTLAAANVPFVLSLLTTATHSPNGFMDKGCLPIEGAQSDIPRGIECSAARILSFMEMARAQEGGEDTIFVILSDHLSYKNTVYPDLGNLGNERRNLVSIADGSGPRVINKEGSHVDVFPTILDTLGYEFKGDRANLGVSLLSENPTLIEQHGHDAINRLFRNNAEMGKYLWR